MWGATDAFHYVWIKSSGDVALAADLTFVGTSAQPHRKACLVIRQSLDAGSVYADAALHGDGLTSLQFRETAGGPTREIQTAVAAPRRLRLEKKGDTVYLSVAGAADELQPTGCSVKVPLARTFHTHA